MSRMNPGDLRRLAAEIAVCHAAYVRDGSDKSREAWRLMMEKWPDGVWNPDADLKLKAVLIGNAADITNDEGNPSEEYSVIDPPSLSMANRLVDCFNACRGEFYPAEMRDRHDRAMALLRQLVADLSVGTPISYELFSKAEQLASDSAN